MKGLVAEVFVNGAPGNGSRRKDLTGGLRAALLAGILVISTFPTGRILAIANGDDAVGNKSVVTMLPGESGDQGYCSGVYFQDYAVVTAAHCIIEADGLSSQLKYPVEQWYVSQPGVNWRMPDAAATRVPVLRIWIPPNYFNRWKPELRQMETQIDDIAFLFLAEPLIGTPVKQSASLEEIETFRNGYGSATHFGYGCLGVPPGESTPTPNDGKPYRVGEIRGTQRRASHIPSADRQLIVDYPWGKSICPGDSGSPLLLNAGSDTYSYLGVIFAGNGWDEVRKPQPSYRAEAIVTVFEPFAKVFNTEYSRFLEDLPRLQAEHKNLTSRAALARQSAIEGGTYAKAPGCHASGISAAVEVQNADGSWTVHKIASGWESSPSGCPSTHPKTAWADISLADGVSIRWKYWTSAWTTYSEPMVWKRSPTIASTTVPTSIPSAKGTGKSRSAKCVDSKRANTNVVRSKANLCLNSRRRT